MPDQTLTVRVDEVQVDDRIDWLGTVATSKRFPIGELWNINTGSGVTDPHAYLRRDTLITVTRPDPDDELVEAMARAVREAWGAAWPEDEGGRERWLTAARAALAALRVVLMGRRQGRLGGSVLAVSKMIIERSAA